MQADAVRAAVEKQFGASNKKETVLRFDNWHAKKMTKNLATKAGRVLGLPAVEKVAQEHGGGLEVTSEEGKGACFTLWFPIACNIREVA